LGPLLILQQEVPTMFTEGHSCRRSLLYFLSSKLRGKKVEYAYTVEKSFKFRCEGRKVLTPRSVLLHRCPQVGTWRIPTWVASKHRPVAVLATFFCDERYFNNFVVNWSGSM
jgi:hypothetical protein